MQEVGWAIDFPPVLVYEMPEIHSCQKKAYSYIAGKIIELMIGLVSDHMDFFNEKKLDLLRSGSELESNALRGPSHESTTLEDIL